MSDNESESPSDRLKAVRNQLGDTQETFAERFEYTQPVYQRYEAGKRRIPQELMEGLKNQIGINLNWLMTGEGEMYGDVKQPNVSSEHLTTAQGSAIRLPLVSFKASAGDGSYVTEQEYEGTYIIDPSELKGVRPSELRDGMFVIEAEGDSMVPDIHPGEQLIIKPVEAPDRIASDAIYLFRLEKRVQIKRLQAFPGGRIRVKSKNTDYDDYELDLDAGHDFEILGLVWGRFERLA
jgi:phage repressor protein C with HTH and peptisase S24 domain